MSKYCPLQGEQIKFLTKSTENAQSAAQRQADDKQAIFTWLNEWMAAQIARSICTQHDDNLLTSRAKIAKLADSNCVE